MQTPSRQRGSLAYPTDSDAFLAPELHRKTGESRRLFYPVSRRKKIMARDSIKVRDSGRCSSGRKS